MFRTFLRVLFTPLRALYHWLLGEGFQSRKSGSGKTRLIIRRELYGLTHEPLMWFCMIVAPLFCVFFFTTMMEEGLPENLPLGIVDLDNSTTSRSLQRNLDAFQMVDVKDEYPPNITEARKAMQRGEIYGFYYIPKGLQRKANRQEQPTVSFYMNYSFLVAGSLLYKDQRIMSELASGAAVRTALFARGATNDQAMAYIQPIVIDSHPISNPGLNYNVYLSNTLIPGMLMLFIFMVTVYSIGMEIKRGTADELMRLADGNIIRAIAGKLFPQLVIWFTVGTIMIVWFYEILRFPCLCGMPIMWGVMTLFIIASQAMGVFMFSALPTPRMGLSFACLWGVLSFSICGMSYPVMAMPAPLQALAWLFPLRHYFMLYVNCALDGYPMLNAWPHIAMLIFFVAAALIMTPRLKHAFLHYAYEA